MESVHPKLKIRYLDSTSYALVPVEAATATISFKNGKSLNEEASIMVGPDGTAWVWFTTIAVDYFSHIAA